MLSPRGGERDGDMRNRLSTTPASTSRGAANTRLILLVILVAVSATLLYLRTTATTSRDEANLAFLASDWDTAIDGYDQILRKSPEDAEAHYYRAIAHGRKRRIRRALDDMKLVRIHPDWERRAFARSVLLYVEDGDVASARKEVRTVANEYLGDSLVHESIGRYYLAAMGMHLESTRRILEGSLSLGRAKSALNRAERVLHADSKVFAASAELFVRQLVENQGFEEITPLREQIELGHAALVAAVASFEKAIRIAEDDFSKTEVPYARYELARILEVRGRIGDVERQRIRIRAIEVDRMNGDLLGALELDKAQGLTTEDLARAYVREKRFDEALVVIEGVALNEVGDRGLNFDTLHAVALDGLNRHDEMLQIVDRWLSRTISLSTMNFLRGRYHLDREEYRDALVYLERSVARNPNDITYNEALALCCARLALDDRAQAIYEHLTDLNPTEHRYVIELASAMERMNWIDDARMLVLEKLNDRFNIPETPPNRDLRRFLDDFLARYGLEPKDLYSAGELWKEDPENFDVGQRLLGFSLDADLEKESRKLAQDLLARCPPSHDAYFDVMMQVGRLFEREGNYARAADCYEKAATGRPHDARSYVARGRVDLANGRLGSVWRTLQKIELLQPKAAGVQELKFKLLVAEGAVKEAANMASRLLPRYATDFEFVMEASAVLIAAGRKKPALEALRNLPTSSRTDPLERIQHGLALVSAGDPVGGRLRIQQTIAVNPRRTSLFVTAVEQLAVLGETDLLIQIVEPRLAKDPSIDTQILSHLAECYLTRDRANDFIDVAVTLFERGQRQQAYSWVSRFCAERDSNDELVSIGEAALTDRVATPEILNRAIEAALDLGDQRRAQAFLRGLTSLPSATESMTTLLKARILDRTGNMVGALDLLAKNLESLPSDERAIRRREMIDILSRRGQTQTILELVAGADGDGDDAELWSLAARHLLRSGDPLTETVIKEGLRRTPDAPGLLIDRALYAVVTGADEGTLDLFRKAFHADPSFKTGRAFGLRAALLPEAKERNAIVAEIRRALPSGTQDLTLQSHYTLRRLLSAVPSRASTWVDEWLDQVAPETVAERRQLRALVVDCMSDEEKTRVLREAWAEIVLLSGFEQTAMRAHERIRKFAESVKGHERCLNMLSARALMGSAATFDEGIEVVSRILADSDVSDEAALLVYAETYLQSGQTEALGKLIEYIQNKGTFGARFYEDMADILMDADLPLVAAALLHQSPSTEVSKSLKQALALYRANRLDRAAELLVASVPAEQAEAIYCRIVGEFLAKSDETLENGYDLVRQSVYKHRNRDPEALLTLARIAMKIGDTVEARKNIRKFISARPASANALVAAFDVVEEFGSEYIALAEWLSGRKALLDPAGYVASNSR